MGSLLFHSKRSTLSLSFDPACYFFTGNDQARYFLFEIVEFAIRAYSGIPEFLVSECESSTLDCGRSTLDAGLWTLDSGRWTLDSGLWTLDSGLWTLDSGCWTLESGGWTLDVGRWTLKTLEARLWTVGIGCWILDVKTLRSTVNPFQANVLFLFNHLKTSKARGFQRFSDDMESELQLEMN